MLSAVQLGNLALLARAALFRLDIPLCHARERHVGRPLLVCKRKSLSSHLHGKRALLQRRRFWALPEAMNV